MGRVDAPDRRPDHDPHRRRRPGRAAAARAGARRDPAGHREGRGPAAGARRTARKLRDELRAQRYGDGRSRSSVDERDLRGGEKEWSGSRRACRSASRSARATSAADTRVRGPPRQRARRRRACRAASSSRASPRSSTRSRTACSRARARIRNEHTREIDTKDEFYAFFTPKSRATTDDEAGDPRRLRAHALRANPALEAKIKDDLGSPCAASRSSRRARHVPVHRQASKQRVVWAKAY